MLTVALAPIFATWGQNGIGLKTWTAAIQSWDLSWPVGAHVLEVGSSHEDWIGKAQKLMPDLVITALDWKGPKVGAGARITGDVLTQEFPAEAFDAIAFISALEHIGLGHYTDPLHPDGDTVAFQRCVGWLKPGGFLYADVPFDPAGYRVFGTKCRIYDEAAIRERFHHPAMTLAGQADIDLKGDPIVDRARVPRFDGGRPFFYRANYWRKAPAGDV